MPSVFSPAFLIVHPPIEPGHAEIGVRREQAVYVSSAQIPGTLDVLTGI